MKSNDFESEDIEFSFSFNEGSIISHVFAAMSASVTNICFELTPYSLVCEYVDDTGQGYDKVIFYIDRIRSYYYNVRDENGDLAESKTFSVKGIHLSSNTKSLKKKQAVILYKCINDDQLRIQKITPDLTRTGLISYVNMQPHESNQKMFDDDKYSDEYNIRNETIEFSEFCKKAITNKSECVEMILTKKGGLFRSLNPDGTSANKLPCGDPISLENERYIKENKNGDIIIESDNIMHKFKLPKKIIKTLSKFSAFSNCTSYIYFYYEFGLPVRIFTPISNFGEYIKYVKKEQPKNNKKK